MESDRWLGVELRHLAALEAVALEGSFGRAAERLGYTQSAVSQQIAMLERLVGERLVERPGGPRPVSLTQAGSLLLGHARGITARLAAAQADMAAFSAGAAGALRIGTYQSVGARILPAVLREFGAAWPDVDVQLVESSDDADLLDGVERGVLDVTFVMLPVEEGPFETVELMRDPYVLVVPAGSELARADRPPTLETIAALELIGYRRCRSVARVEEHLRALGLAPAIAFRSDDNSTIQGLVGAGIGTALVPLLTVEQADDSVTIVPLAEELPPRLIGIAWHGERYRSPAARAFVDTAAAVCERLAPDVAAAA